MTAEQEAQLLEDMRQVKTAVVGNAEYRHLGLIQRMTELEAWRARIDLRVAGMSGATVVAVFVIKWFLTGKL